MTAQLTTEHPYAMYTAIHSQAEEISNVELKSCAAIDRLADYARRVEHVTLIGIGSSLHAAQLAHALWREQLPQMRVNVAHAFDIATGFSSLGGDGSNGRDCKELAIVLSHRGSKRYSRQSLLLAKETGCATCLITGEGVEVSANDADLHITTVPQERSSAHTVSLIGSLAVLVGAIERLSSHLRGELVRLLREAVVVGVRTESFVHSFAKSVSPGTRHIWLVGAGSDVVTAREIALKIKETSYIPAEGMSVEEMLHGPFQCADPSDLLIAIDTQSVGSARISSLLQMAEVIGLPTLTVGESQPEGDANSGTFLSISPSDCRTLNSVSALVALQLFTYFLALERGKNPDSFRLEEAKFREAASIAKL